MHSLFDRMTTSPSPTGVSSTGEKRSARRTPRVSKSNRASSAGRSRNPDAFLKSGGIPSNWQAGPQSDRPRSASPAGGRRPSIMPTDAGDNGMIVDANGRLQRRVEHPRTKQEREDRNRDLILARARGRSPTRWGPAGERKMSLETRPRWRPVAGFPAASTAITEHRKHNPFADLNSYASGVVNGRKGYRPLDAKGIGAKPVQAWKEMLRGAHSY